MRWEVTRSSLHCKGSPGLLFGECLKGSRGEAAVETLVRLSLLDGAAPRGSAALPAPEYPLTPILSYFDQSQADFLLLPWGRDNCFLSPTWMGECALLLLKDKLRHIKFVRVYLSTNSNWAVPNHKWLEVLHCQELGTDIYREQVEARQIIILDWL